MIFLRSEIGRSRNCSKSVRADRTASSALLKSPKRPMARLLVVAEFDAAELGAAELDATACLPRTSLSTCSTTERIRFSLICIGVLRIGY